LTLATAVEKRSSAIFADNHADSFDRAPHWRPIAVEFGNDAPLRAQSVAKLNALESLVISRR
jgi:hypothetical protein